MIVLAGLSNPVLAQQIAAQLPHAVMGEIERRDFPNGELKPRILTDCKGKDVLLVQSFSHPVHRHIIEFVLLADAARRMGAKTIVGVVPWLAYTLQNKVFLPGEPVSAEVLAHMLDTVGLDQLLLVHLHHPELVKLFHTPAKEISILPLIVEDIKANYADSVIVAPDHGGVAYARLCAEKTELSFAIADKSRHPVTGIVEITAVSGDIRDKTCVVVDDVINTGGTVVKVAEALKQNGAKNVVFYTTHGLFAGDAVEKLQHSPLSEIVVTDSVATPSKKLQKLRVLSIATILADAVHSEI